MMAPISRVFPMPVAMENASEGKSRSKPFTAGTIDFTFASSAAINIFSIPGSVGGFCKESLSVSREVSSNAAANGLRSERR